MSEVQIDWKGYTSPPSELIDATYLSANIKNAQDAVRKGSSSFRVEPNSHNDSWSSSPVGMCAGRFSACAHVRRAGLSRRMIPWALP